ncbi:hypothetical protein FQN51_009112 [Onygenales sp. PD_10]|nr:hypothetical protein FQN51_009112 [Onygenales sp. PD_10]
MGSQPGEPEAGKEPEAEPSPPWRNFWRMLGHGTALDKFMMSLAAICAVGAGVTLPLMNVVFGNLVDDFNGYFIPGSGVTKDDFTGAVNRNVLAVPGLSIHWKICAWVHFNGKSIRRNSTVKTKLTVFKFCLRMTGIRISARLRLSYLSALFSQPISVFDSLPPGRPTTTITTSSNTVQAGISDRIALLIQSSALVIGAYAVAFRFSWSLTLLASTSMVFISLVNGGTLPIYMKAYKSVEKADEKASSIATEALGSIRTIVACGAEGRLAARYAEWVSVSRKRGLGLGPLTGIQTAPANFAMYGSFALTFWFGVKQYNSGNLSGVGPLVTVVFSVLLIISTLSFILRPILDITQAVSASTYFFEMIDAPKLKKSGLKSLDVSTSDDIYFKDVTFSYPSRPKAKILNSLSLHIPAGKLTALVGPSGCGKSTIVALLERWYQIGNQFEEGSLPDTTSPENEDPPNDKLDENDAVPNSGEITINRYRIDDLDLKWWRSQIGLVQQEPFIFNSSIYQNVAYGLVGSQWENETEEVKRDLVKEACQEAFASEYIERLPLKYDTMVGEGGLKLSGGQRQRLAIARSIIKRPPILILDEATSSIDVHGERIVQEALDRVSKNRTTITIAHRLSTIKKADNIIVLKGGESFEQGTHEELLRQKGIYYELVENQRLEMGDESSDLETEVESKDQIQESNILTEERRKSEPGAAAEQTSETAYEKRSLVGLVGLLLWEQRKYWPLYVSIVVGAAGAGAVLSLQSFIFAQLTTVFQLEGPAMLERSQFWSLMFVVLAVAVGISHFVLGWTSSAVGTYMCTTYRQEYFENILAKHIPFYDMQENSTGSLSGRLSTDPTQLQQIFGLQLAYPLISVFTVIGCLAISFAFGWKLTLVAMFSAFPLIIIAMFIRMRYEIQFVEMNQAVFQESSQFASEAIGAFRTVTSLTLEDMITTRYSDLLKDHVKKAFIRARFAMVIFSASDSIDLPCMALCFWYGGQLLSTFEYDVLQFMVIYIAVVLGGQTAGQFGSITPNVAQAAGASNRIFSVREPESSNDDDKIFVERYEGGPRIEFKSVSFKYPTRDVTVFKNLSFTVEKGQFVALVGASGCGKSTVIGILEKFYDYQDGSVIIDGHELRSLDTSSYRQSVSLVSQEPNLYQGSVKDNITLGVDPTTVTDDDIQQAAKDANIHDFIVSLPEGYNTDVGLRGLAMSGGQKQRICIARALLRSPSLLLLDEATSSLDSESEKHVQEAIERTAKGRTVVVVAHRLATVQNADTIFVFGEGGILEVGTHAALIKNRGAYYEMCQSQALDR